MLRHEKTILAVIDPTPGAINVQKSKYDVGNTLLSASNIILVGFVLKDLKLATKGVNYPPTRDNANNFFGKMLAIPTSAADLGQA